MNEFDLVVIGSGPGGERAALQAASFGKRVAIVERAPEPGGAAVHTGTLPSKTLRETALYLSGHRKRELYGVGVNLERSATLQTLMRRKRSIAAVESKRIRQTLSELGVEFIAGHGRLEGPSRVVVESLVDGSRRVLSTEIVVVATGSSPRRPVDVEFESPRIHDSDLVLEIDVIPSSMIVLGAGVIGCEYACMFAALGVAVTLVDARMELLSFLDDEIRERLEQAMVELGVTLVRPRRWGPVRDVGGAAEVEFDDGSTMRADQVLFAAGRLGCTSDLGLETVGLAHCMRGCLSVDENFQTSAPGIYAVGDVIGFPALASASMEQGRIAVCRAFGVDVQRKMSPVIPYGIYTIPEVSCVGESERACREAGRPVVVGRADFRLNARGQIQGDLGGMIKLVVCATSRRVLGTHVIGERASELVHLGQAAILMEATIDLFVEMVFNYPTISEAYKQAAYDCISALQAPGGSIAPRRLSTTEKSS
ncbi:MAG: Si-specific NAD(P)(+) transhydrogenase [Polyangiales bacterium]